MPTAGGDVAGLPGLLGAVLELLDVVELLGVFGVVVVELPPDETFETVSETGNAVVCDRISQLLYYIYHMSVYAQELKNVSN